MGFITYKAYIIYNPQKKKSGNRGLPIIWWDSIPDVTLTPFSAPQLLKDAGNKITPHKNLHQHINPRKVLIEIEIEVDIRRITSCFK